MPDGGYVRRRSARSYVHRPTTRKGKIEFGAVFLVLVLAFGGGGACWAYAHERTATVTVTGKERVCDRGTDGNQDCKYLVFTDKTTFRITDYIGRVTSSDAYGRIKVCHRYFLRYYGFRFGLTSSYPNIKSADDRGLVPGCREDG